MKFRWLWDWVWGSSALSQEKALIFDEWVATPLEDRFNEECSDRADRIPLNGNLDWYSVAVGWALANGLAPDEADRFAMRIMEQSDHGRP